MAVKHSVRSTLLALGLGVLWQRLLQLVTFAIIGRQLAVEGLGYYASGLAAAAALAVLAGAGVRNVLARAIAQAPAAATALWQEAVRQRWRRGLWLLWPALAIVWIWSSQPWFYTLCLLQVLPAACDGKHLLDAAGQARREVALESATATLHLLLVMVWAAVGGSLAWLAASALATRLCYAVAILALLPRNSTATTAQPAAPPAAPLLTLGQTAHELLATGDVWLVALGFGPAAAGCYALASRLATAALLPSAQLARLLLPHLLRAEHQGHPARTLALALRATGFAAVPVVAGGWVMAAPLCAFFGAEFAAAAMPLRLLLLALLLQHLGWQASHALLAAQRDRSFALGLLLPALLQCCLLGLSASLGGDAVAASAAAMLAMLVYLLAACWPMRRELRWSLLQPLWPIALVAATTAMAAALPAGLLDGPARLWWQLAAGGSGFALALYATELRGRLAGVGSGLARASGLGG
jgi:O-antigen/teichoic acid export membrane protein